MYEREPLQAKTIGLFLLSVSDIQLLKFLLRDFMFEQFVYSNISLFMKFLGLFVSLVEFEKILTSDGL